MRNPALGLLPLLVFSFLVIRVDLRVSMMIALTLSIIGFLVADKHSRLIYIVSIIAFVVSGVWSMVTYADIFYYDQFIVVEAVFLLSLIGVRLIRKDVVYQTVKNDRETARSYLFESLRVAFQAQYGLSIHLLLVLLIYIFRTSDAPTLMITSGLVICQIILIAIIVVEEIRLHILDKKLRMEEWLPIVNEEGSVIGRVAKSVTKELGGKFMHPAVRVAFIYDGKLYLQERSTAFQLDPGRLDYPIEKLVLFKHEIATTVKEGIQKIADNAEIPLRFLLKYKFENPMAKRLVFLYVSDIDNEEQFNKLNFNGGKLWTTKQIEDNINTGVFSECFELEYEYLKNTVLLAKDFLKGDL